MSLQNATETTFTSSLYPVYRQVSIDSNKPLTENPAVYLTPENNFYRKERVCRGFVSEDTLVTFCPNCESYKVVSRRCHLRNCPVCADYTRRRIRDIFYPALQRQIRRNGGLGYNQRLIFGTLTYRPTDTEHVPADKLGSTVRWLRNRGSKFLLRYFPLGALIVVEHTYNPSSDTYYLHLHFLGHGWISDASLFHSEWGYITRFEDAQIPPGSKARTRTVEETLTVGMGYLLKYVTKGVEVQDKDLSQIKGVRYVVTVGKFNRMERPKYLCKCKKCLVMLSNAAGSNAESIIRKGVDLPPLEVEREITWPTRSRTKALKQAKLLLRRFIDGLKGDKWKFVKDSFYNSDQTILDVFNASVVQSNNLSYILDGHNVATQKALWRERLISFKKFLSELG